MKNVILKEPYLIGIGVNEGSFVCFLLSPERAPLSKHRATPDGTNNTLFP